jgi:hypothetical protein
MPARVVLGDVLTIPLDERRVCIAQAVGSYIGGCWFVAFFEGRFELFNPPPFADVVRTPVCLLGLSFVARVHSGDWTVVANEPVDASVPLPAFREMVGTPDRVDVVGHSGKLGRRARPGEIAMFPNRSIVSPMVLERACRAHAGLEPWLSRFRQVSTHRGNDHARDVRASVTV